MRHKYEYFRKERVLAVDPMPQGFGYMILEDEPVRLVDWGVSSCRRRRQVSCDQAIARVLERYKPTSFVIEAPADASPMRRNALSAFIEGVADVVTEAKVPVFAYSRHTVRQGFASSNAFTKQQIAELLAGQFPELLPRLPRPREVWESEDSRMSIFDALALALTDLNERVGSTGSKSK